MNKHIYEFAKQAGIQHRLDTPNEIWGWDENLEKFANLIISECIHTIEDFEIIDRNGTPIEQVVDALCRIRCEIKEKFEIK